jgi:5-formyltetrahydrofolate cyclo-ligase
MENQEIKEIRETKAELRRQIKEKKRQLTKDEMLENSQIIIEKLMSQPEYQTSSRLYAYVSYNQEVSTHTLIEMALQDGKTVLVPKVYGDVMKYHEIHSMQELKPGAYGILEPECEEPDYVHEGLLLLPGLAFDYNRHRMGYGGGFYDKYLSEYPNHTKIALAYDFQLLRTIPEEEHDIPADMIITEQHIIR